MSKNKNILISVFFMGMLVFFFLKVENGGGMEKKAGNSKFQDIPPETWQQLKDKRIYFGHQSVGNNIIKGINDVIQEHRAIELTILETTNVADFEKPIFAHSKIGQNENPLSKINSFSDVLQNGLGEKLNIAFLKFCFVDIDEKTDLSKIFQEYKLAMDTLSKRYPSVKFVYVTVPLLKRQGISIKQIIKSMLGGDKDFFHEDNNIARNEFNQMIIKEYKDTGRVFDLAMIEAKKPDGTMVVFKKNEQAYYALADEYTNDGGHLNEIGRKKVAEELLLFLANLQ